MKNIQQINSFVEISRLIPESCFTFPPAAINYYGIKFISHGVQYFNCAKYFYLYIGEKKYLVPEIAKSNVENIIVSQNIEKKFISILEQYKKNIFHLEQLNIIIPNKT